MGVEVSADLADVVGIIKYYTLYCVEKEQRITKCFISWWNRIQPLLVCIGTCTLDKGEHIHHPIKRISPFTSWNMFYT